MRKHIILALVVVLLIISAGGLSIFTAGMIPSESSTEIDKGVGVATNVSEVHPLSIAGMKQTSIDTVGIEVVREVRQTEGFVSTVIEFSVEGIKQYALMNTPKGKQPESGWPVVIVNHGYIPPNEFSTERSYINTSAYFASAGFVVVKPDYRGHAQSEGTAESIKDRIGYGADVLGVLSLLSKIPNVNTRQVFLWGHSMGGDVSLRAALVCGKCVLGMSLWAPAVTNYPEQLTYFRRQNSSEVGKILDEYSQLTSSTPGSEFSTFAQLGVLEVPVVIHHGTNDESVPYSWGALLNDKLNKLGKQVKMYSYQGDNHDISNNWSTALRRDADWFRSLIDK